MYLQTISLLNFKNYPQAELNFSQSINCFVGNNGVGKTNLLDAIYYLSMCKSYFNSSDTQNIKQEALFFMLQGNYFLNHKIENIVCSFKRGQKKLIKRNTKEYKKLSEHIGLLPIIMISPNDSHLITGSSEERRKLIDSIISQFDKIYLEKLISYHRAIEQRNQMLKDLYASEKFDTDLFSIWDEKLCELGNYIHRKRKEFIDKLLPIFRYYYNFLTNESETVNLIYESQLNDNQFSELLLKNFDKDRMLQYTSVGVHRDDLAFELEGNPIKKRGSQGQQKTYLVALKFAHFDFMKLTNSFKPLLLLDDIFDKLDELRVRKIVELVSNHNFGQIFITNTDLERMQKALNNLNCDFKIFIITKEAITETTIQ